MTRLKQSTLAPFALAITEAEMLSQLPGLAYCEMEPADLDADWRRVAKARLGTSDLPS